jgi:hypothetical protein
MMESNSQHTIKLNNYAAEAVEHNNMPRPIIPPSPAPVVVKGGEDEFVNVSRLGSVEVKAVAVAGISGGGAAGGSVRRISMNLPTKTRNYGSFSSTSTSSGYNYKNDNGNDNDNDNDNDNNGEFDKEEEENIMKDTNREKKEKGKNEKEEENIILYDDITKSPYEPDMIGEKGEYIFKEMKQLLLNNKNAANNRAMYDDDDHHHHQHDNDHDHSDDNYDVATSEEVKVGGSGEKKKKKSNNKYYNNDDSNNKNGINQKMIRMFGPTNSRCLIDAYELIDKSGMVYSELWTKGNIRGNMVGVIPNHLLLLVLQPNRFIKAGELLLSGLCRDLEVYISINHALDDWKLYKKYKSVSVVAIIEKVK